MQITQKSEVSTVLLLITQVYWVVGLKITDVSKEYTAFIFSGPLDSYRPILSEPGKGLLLLVQLICPVQCSVQIFLIACVYILIAQAIKTHVLPAAPE
jgi:hypothetical protein